MSSHLWHSEFRLSHTALGTFCRQGSGPPTQELLPLLSAHHRAILLAKMPKPGRRGWNWSLFPWEQL